MDINSSIVNNLIYIKVIPHARKTKLIKENNKLKLYVPAIAENNKANEAVVKFFKKEYNLAIKIKSGLRSREKILELI